MAKTRNRTKISAVNNARTRGAKSKAQSGGQGGATAQTPARRRGKKSQATRSPSPVAGSSNPPARAPSPAVVPADQPSCVLDTEALSRNAILKEGWYLLQSYFNDTASADEVYAFLKDVHEAELESAFADITGCEPDDEIKNADLALTIASRIEDLETIATKPNQPGKSSVLLRYKIN